MDVAHAPRPGRSWPWRWGSWGLALAALSVGACAAVTPSMSAAAFTIHVLDVSGPAIEVIAAGRPVASVACGGGTDIRSADASLPATPFEIIVRRADNGAILGRTNVTTPADMAIQVRDTTASFGQAFTGGPSVGPEACARWSQQP
jgi:hypothetical protein